MADEDMAGDYFDDEDDFDWLYIEDTLPLADELAETSIPDPGYAGTKAELEDFWDDLDLYAYWDDLEYGHDSYWDSAGTAMTGQKRKRGDAVDRTSGKARKMTLKETEGGAAVFVRMADRWKLWNRRAPVRKDLKPFSLLVDWRKRCVKADNKASVKPMPVEMKQAAEGNDVDTPEGARHFDTEAVEGDEGEWEDDEGEEEGDSAGLANIDPEMLKTVLRQKLGDAGLGDMNEGAFMQTMMKMMSGEGGSDEAAGELANSLLGSAGQGGEPAFSGWLSQQGVSLDQAGEDGDDADSVATAEIPAPSNSTKKGKNGAQVSPPDSAIEMLKQGKTAQMAMHDGSPKSAKKRLAPVEDEESGSARKRKKVAFDAPASQDTTAASEADRGDANATSEDQDLLEAQPAVAEDDTNLDTAAPSKSTRAKARSTNASDSAENKTAPKSRTASKAKAEPAPPAPSGPAKSTRKRKAQGEEAEPPPPAKKQTGKAAATGKEEKSKVGPSYARPTRSTRARSGK